MERKDYFGKCGIGNNSMSKCDGGLQCLNDNGKGIYCRTCMCAKCTRGKC